LTIALVTPVAFFASAGHSYLAPLGFVFLTLLLAQVVAVAGWGEYFPWSIPALFAQGEPLGAISYVIVVVTCAVGIAATISWWKLADQTH
jgi:ABC-2 type transport system permease protein